MLKNKCKICTAPTKDTYCSGLCRAKVPFTTFTPEGVTCSKTDEEIATLIFNGAKRRTAKKLDVVIEALENGETVPEAFSKVIHK